MSSQVKSSHFASHIYVPIFFLHFFFSVATKMSFYKWQMQCFPLLCDFVNALHKYKKNETKKLLNLKRLYIHLKRILYRFIYVHIMYMFSCWWYDRQCLDIFPSCLLHLAVLEKKRDTCLINASYAHHRFYFWYFSLMFIFKLTRCFKYAVKTESESNPRWVLFFVFLQLYNLNMLQYLICILQNISLSTYKD